MPHLHLIGDVTTTLEPDWKREQIVALAGDLAVDASRTSPTPGKRHLDIVCAAGDVELRVPRSAGVDVWGPPIGRDTTLTPASDTAPVIRVRFLRLMGDLELIQTD